MSEIGDELFGKFLSNDLTMKEMLEVEESLISNGEADSSLHASIMNYRHNLKIANELLGDEVEQNSETDESPHVVGNASNRSLSDNLTKELLGTGIALSGLGNYVKYRMPVQPSRIPGMAASVFSEHNDRIQGKEPLISRETSKDEFIMGKTIIGEEGMNIKDPIYIQQPDDHSCALRSQQIILRDFGIDIPFEDLEQFALENNIYSENGTYMFDIGKVMDAAGVPVHATTGNTIDVLMKELSQGHRVIVGVDANELWYNETLGDKFKNFFDDVFGVQGGNHALIVAGLEIDPSDPANISVILTDPGSGELRISYPAKQFSNAWADSNCFMVATDNAAPYQYDPETHMEVPSNIYVEQHMNEWIQEHSYMLNPDMINIPDNYSPHYSSLNTGELYGALGIDPTIWDDVDDLSTTSFIESDTVPSPETELDQGIYTEQEIVPESDTDMGPVAGSVYDLEQESEQSSDHEQDSEISTELDDIIDND